MVRDFSTLIQRGDKVGLIGRNGVGKTTVLKMLLGQEAPDEGTVKLGTNLDIAVFDQARAQLDPNLTLWENLASDPVLGASGKSDQVMVRGTPKHVVGYLKEFLFDEAQARAPVRSLSGGEKEDHSSPFQSLPIGSKHRQTVAPSRQLKHHDQP